MPKRSDKPPRDPNQLGKWIIDKATGQLPAKAQAAAPKKDPAAVELGRRGGLKGGPARAERLSKAKLSAIGKKGARARWKRAK